MNLLHVDNITVSFDGFKAVNGLSFDIEPKELTHEEIYRLAEKECRNGHNNKALRKLEQATPHMPSPAAIIAHRNHH